MDVPSTPSRSPIFAFCIRLTSSNFWGHTIRLGTVENDLYMIARNVTLVCQSIRHMESSSSLVATT